MHTTSFFNSLFCLAISLFWLTAGVAAAADHPATSPATTQPAGGKANRVQADAFFSEGMIPRLRIEVAQPEMEALRRQPRVYARATLHDVTPGQPTRTFTDVAIHVKGFAGSTRSIDDKPALTVSFTKHQKGRRFHGLKKIHLNNSVQDPTYLCESVGSVLFRAAGVPAARATHARVWLNNRDLGFFVLMEGIDEVFFSHYFADDSGSVFEANCREIDQIEPSPPNAPKKKDVTRLRELAAATRERDPAVRRQRLAKLLDVDRFVTFAALEAMVVHWDGYCGNRNNYRAYDDPATGQFTFIPHGMDQIFQRPGDTLLMAGGIIARAVTDDPEDRAAYFERVAQLRQRVLDPEALAKHIDQVTARTLPVLAEMNPNAAREHKQHAENLRRRIAERARNIDQQLASMPKPLKFNASGLAGIATWNAQQDGGKATIERFEESGKPIWRIRSAPGGSTASLRARVLLTRGKYVFEGRCRTIGVKAQDGSNSAAGLRISGGQRNKRMTGDSDWQPMEFEFEVNDQTREVTLVCELRATAGEAQFEAESLRLRKK